MSNPVVGQRVIAIRLLTDEELEMEYWEHMGVETVALELGDGTIIYASSDTGGNSPGQLIHRTEPAVSHFITLPSRGTILVWEED